MHAQEFRVERVEVERVLALRQAVLRPHLGPQQRFELPDDRLESTLCLGAVLSDGTVVGTARLTREPPPFDARAQRSWRLRGMATAPSFRRRGVGSAIMRVLGAHVSAEGGGVLWCNARLAAVGFYEQGGLRRWGEVWDEPEIGPHVVMWTEVPAAGAARARAAGAEHDG